MIPSDDELREQGLERVPGASMVQDVRYFNLHLTFGDIPEPDPCPSCGASMQKEFLEFKTESGSLTIRADVVPGYGCTGCPSKLHDPHVFLQLLNNTEAIAREAGKLDLAEHLKGEAASHDTMLRLSESRQK